MALGPVARRVMPELDLPSLPELHLPDVMRVLDPQERAEQGRRLLPATIA